MRGYVHSYVVRRSPPSVIESASLGGLVGGDGHEIAQATRTPELGRIVANVPTRRPRPWILRDVTKRCDTALVDQDTQRALDAPIRHRPEVVDDRLVEHREGRRDVRPDMAVGDLDEPVVDVTVTHATARPARAHARREGRAAAVRARRHRRGNGEPALRTERLDDPLDCRDRSRDASVRSVQLEPVTVRVTTKLKQVEAVHGPLPHPLPPSDAIREKGPRDKRSSTAHGATRGVLPRDQRGRAGGAAGRAGGAGGRAGGALLARAGGAAGGGGAAACADSSTGSSCDRSMLV